MQVSLSRGLPWPLWGLWGSRELGVVGEAGCGKGWGPLSDSVTECELRPAHLSLIYNVMRCTTQPCTLSSGLKPKAPRPGFSLQFVGWTGPPLSPGNSHPAHSGKDWASGFWSYQSWRLVPS